MLVWSLVASKYEWSFHRGIAKDVILIKFWIFSSPVMTAYFIDT